MTVVEDTGTFLRAKGFHAVGLAAAMIHGFAGRGAAVAALAAGLIVQTIFDVRQRTEERPGPSPAWWAVLGCLGAVGLFPAADIARAACLCLAFADPAGEWVGRRLGRLRIGEKSAEGTLAVFLTAWAVGTLCLSASPGRPDALVGAMAVAVVEAFSTRWNDNLTVPLAAGAALTLLRSWT